MVNVRREEGSDARGEVGVVDVDVAIDGVASPQACRKGVA
jgi:hypothetical protein